MKKYFLAGVLTVTSILSVSAFALTDTQLDVIVQQQTDYNAENSELISLKQACEVIVSEDQNQLKQEYISQNPLEVCPTTDYMLFKACTERNADNIKMRNAFDTKASIISDDCDSL